MQGSFYDIYIYWQSRVGHWQQVPVLLVVGGAGNAGGANGTGSAGGHGVSED